MTTTMVNKVILDSIPIDKKLKRYFLSKYQILCDNNGLAYAADVFSQLRVIALEYRADYSRIENRETYIQKCPVRKNGWLRMLFDYLDSHPSYVLNFLKLYVGLNEPLVSVEKSANDQHAYLDAVSVNTDIPKHLRAWVNMIGKPILSESQWWHLRNGVIRNEDAGELRFIRTHSYREYVAYYKKWRRVLCSYTPTDNQLQIGRESKEPLPEMYKDFDGLSSQSLENDLFDLFGMCAYAEGGGWSSTPTLTPGSLKLVLDMLNPSFLLVMEEFYDGLWRPEGEVSFLSGEYVGFIHHIPKKGTIKRRPIAVPNRFLQMGMTPVYQALSGVVAMLPRDATFNQSRFDQQIQNRVNNSNLYIGSVDLSQATDNLPFSWGEYIVDELIIDRQPQLVKSSWGLFKEISRSRWNNDGIITRWTKGQPLGALPSFNVLSLTHNIYLESLAFWNGYGHSPYAVLGDDVVIFTKKLRKQYIRDLGKRGIPLSLHKSFEGNLTEFAGKTYIKNQIPFYTSDQTAIHWNNLFDYQVATGILIPFEKLPKAVRKRFRDKVLSVKPNAGNSVVNRVYHLVQMANIHRATSHFDYEAEDQSLINYFYELASSETTTPDPDMRTGLVMAFGNPITYLDYGYAEKHGHKQRFTKVKLPEWFRDKYRPTTTDTLVRCASIALTNTKGRD